MFDDTNRPRIGLAAVITVLALVVWAVAQGGTGDDDGDSATAATTASTTAPVATAINGVPLEQPVEPINATQTASTASDEPSRPRVEDPDDVPVFMDGEAPSSTIGVPLIAVPEEPAVQPLRLSASFRSTISGFRTCLVQDLESGTTVTITNLANNRSVTCVTALAPANQIDEVVMHTRTFQQIADLTEAPITVEVTR